MQLLFYPPRQNAFHAAQRSSRPAETSPGSSRCGQECTYARGRKGWSVRASSDACAASFRGIAQTIRSATSAKTDKRRDAGRCLDKHAAERAQSTEIAFHSGASARRSSNASRSGSSRSGSSRSGQTFDAAPGQCCDKPHAKHTAKGAFDSGSSARDLRRRKVDGSGSRDARLG